MYIDLFAAALDDTCTVDAKLEATATVAPSEAMAATEIEAISSDDCMEISEVPAVSMAAPHLPDTPEKVSCHPPPLPLVGKRK